jgi:SAM-dependent methyltransferase
MSYLLPKVYFPTHQENRMTSEGDVTAARARFLTERPNNLNFLLKQRYVWMNRYLRGKDRVIELGSGAGFAKEFISNPSLKLTDIVKHPWIDEQVDAMNLPYEPESLDAIICSHMIHHIASPVAFFKQAKRTLKKDGVILICEIYTSLLMKTLLRVMRHEGWSYDVDIFDERQVANDPSDPWSANCAIPQLLFSDAVRFSEAIPGMKIERHEPTECMIFPLSGGVIAKTKTFHLPMWALGLIQKLDRGLIAISPRLFALGMRVVVRRTE